MNNLDFFACHFILLSIFLLGNQTTNSAHLFVIALFGSQIKLLQHQQQQKQQLQEISLFFFKFEKETSLDKFA